MGKTTVILGHYGSGKTEFSINYTLKTKESGVKTALLDLDIANPYFRSRERQNLLMEKGVDVYFNEYGYDLAEDLPAISAKIRAPLENKDYHTIADIGGNDSGARIINQFRKYFEKENSSIYLLLNANRPETDTLDGAKFHLESIQNEINLPINGIINNTHMLSETTPDDIIKGYKLSKEVSDSTGIPLIFSTCVKPLIPKLKSELEKIKTKNPGLYNNFKIFPILLYMRPTWLDAKL